MNIIGDGVLRLHQIQQFPIVKLTRDENENCSICIGDFNKNEIILILPCVVSVLFASATFCFNVRK